MASASGALAVRCGASIACGRDAAAFTSPRGCHRCRRGCRLRKPQIPPEKKRRPPSQTGGFDGAKAYEYISKLVSFGPRPPASDAMHRTQDYIHRATERLRLPGGSKTISTRRRPSATSR